VRRGRRLRSLGWTGAFLSIAISATTQLGSRTGSTALVVAGVGLAASLLLINWTRLWVRESKEPFQFTFSIEDLEAGPDALSLLGSSTGRNPLLWLRRDLTQKLGERIGRLSLLEDSQVPAEEPLDDAISHVHISGWYGLRRTEKGDWCIEVVPRVRLGGTAAPHKLARAINFRLGPPGASSNQVARLHPPSLTNEQYRLLFERVYWSVASEIYAQIRHGVETKVRLLPPGRLRAAAYLHEADDYATSNTLDAYDSARSLYLKALEMYDVFSRDPAASSWRRFFKGLRMDLDRDWCRLRRVLSKVFRRLARREVLAARSQLGYARMLVSEWYLRLLSGSIPKEMFEARPRIEDAIRRLERLPADVAERKETLFRAFVTLAVAKHDLQDLVGARKVLDRAEELVPQHAREDAEFLLAEALIERDHIRSLRLLARAIELRPTMERARFRRAELLEQLWRRQKTFEAEVAETVDEEYAEVIAINPGNVSAWANRGYIGWLLSPADAAEERIRPDGSPTWHQRAYSYLDAGRQYKDVRRDAMVAELNWSLARFAAEKGDFPEAYRQYIQAVSPPLAEPRLDFVRYFHANSTEEMIKRFQAYEDRVRGLAEEAGARAPGEQRLIDSVLAFVLNECGLVRHAYYLRTGDQSALLRSVELFEEAVKLNPHFVLPKYNLSGVGLQMAAHPVFSADRTEVAKEARRYISEVLETEPHWFFARLRMVKAQEIAQSASDGAEFEKWLRPLLPHRVFRQKGRIGGRVDHAGRHVTDLLRERNGRWSTEFNEIQVVALIVWANLLASREPRAGLELSEKIRDVFYRGSPDVLDAYIASAQKVCEEASGRDGAQRLESEIEDCEEIQAANAVATLKEDPSHDYELRRLIGALGREDRERALREAQAAPPSATTQEWIEEVLSAES